MIVDKARIFIKAGNGGNGAVAFHREKYVANGGPDGGDGGNGGDIVFVADCDTRTLVDFQFKTKYSAQSGEPGRGKNMRGKNGEDLIIKVPLGTVVIDEESGRIVADLSKKGVQKTLLKGGKGGKGNARFATPTRQAPRFSTPGRKTVGRHVILELKSIADVGLIGFPSVGKSTLLSVISSARPKIAAYHFTTLNPNLGVVKYKSESFVVADIPGLIEGASQGAGLGHEFLRHIERTRMLVHVLDASGSEGRDPIDDYYKIRKELEQYSSSLAEKPEIIAANKADISDEFMDKLKAEFEPKGIKIFSISAATREGIDELLSAICAQLRDLPPVETLEEEGVIEEWQMGPGPLSFEVSRGMDGIMEVNGSAIDEIFMRIDPNDPDSMRHFEKLLVDMGIIEALRNSGVKDGDEIRLNGETFDFVD